MIDALVANPTQHFTTQQFVKTTCKLTKSLYHPTQGD